jgi:hypothetical protein
VEIIPAVGVPSVQIGQAREDVESRLGLPKAAGDVRAYYEAPGLLVHYDDSDRVELVEVPYGHGSGEEATLDGLQLTFRFMEEVRSDLAARGYTSTPSDIGYDFAAGFSIFSMASCDAGELDAAAGEDDERRVVEGVSVAPYEYFVTPNSSLPS